MTYHDDCRIKRHKHKKSIESKTMRAMQLIAELDANVRENRNGPEALSALEDIRERVCAARNELLAQDVIHMPIPGGYPKNG